MPNSTTRLLSSTAFRRLGTKAKAAGMSREAYFLDRLEKGFGIPGARVLANVLADAEANIPYMSRQHRA